MVTEPACELPKPGKEGIRVDKRFFGFSSERRGDDIPSQLNLFDEAEVEQDPSLPNVKSSNTIARAACKSKVDPADIHILAKK